MLQFLSSEVTESLVQEFVIVCSFATDPWALAKWMFSSLLEPFGSLLMRDGRWDLSSIEDDLSG